MRDEFGPNFSCHQYQRVSLHAVWDGFRERTERGAQGKSPRAFQHLCAAHPRPTVGDELGDGRRKHFRRAPGRQREGNKFEAIGHGGG
ncbi:hypothetical protein PWR05_35860 [Paraburkholderia sp. A2RI-6]|uniref:hypothetical protein n=1 Tax=Paraburkholderia sp. A2RI-6 TaxID=3028371 RepID=UPI003B779809